ncbi:hypothetical protein BH11MYX3_BH11MYX3_31240 [soil metagenome]
MGSRLWLIVGIAIGLGGCAPTVDGPLERQRAADRDDADHLAAQLGRLPGAISASVTLHRAARDPLGVAGPTLPAGVVLIVTDDGADRAALSRTAATLFSATAPEIMAPAIEVVVGAHRPALASVGPFTVEESSKPALRIVLAIALSVIAALAGWVAVREAQRRGQ